MSAECGRASAVPRGPAMLHGLHACSATRHFFVASLNRHAQYGFVLYILVYN